MPFAEINGLQLYYQQGGEGENVVFIHGGFASLALQLKLPVAGEWGWSWEWDFARHFNFVWYDRRGCYHTTRPTTNDYRLETQVTDLDNLFNHLKLDSAHLIGSSAGGPIAITFAAMFPHRVKSLVLTGTACNVFPDDDPITALIKEQIATLEAQGAESAFDARPEGVHTSIDVLWEIEEARERGTLQQYLASQKMLAQQATTYPLPVRAQWYAAELCNIKAYMTESACQKARHVDVPTLILHGEKDQAVALSWAQALTSYIPAVELIIVDGGSHGLLFRHEGARRMAIEFMLANNL